METSREDGIRSAEIQTTESVNNVTGHKGTKFARYGGFIYALLSALSVSLATFLGKLLVDKNYDAISMAIWKYQGMTLFGPILLLYFRFWKKEDKILECIWPLSRQSLTTIFFLVLRGSLGVGGTIFHTQSMKYLSMADTNVIVFSTPITVVLFARLFLSEPCGVVSILLALFTFSGVCVLARPPLLTGEESFDASTLIGVAFAFASMIFMSSVFIVIRHLRHAHFSLLINFYGYVGTIESLFLALSFGVLGIPQTPIDWLIAAGHVLLHLAGQMFMIFSLQTEFAGIVSLVRTCDVVCAFIWQMFIGIYPDMFSLIGAGIVVTAILVSGFTKWLSSLPINHKTRRKFWFLLR